MTWSYIDTKLDGYSNIQGNYVFYLPQGTISVFLGGSYPINNRPSDYALPINGGTGNFQNSIGYATTKINADFTETVTITFYDKAVYPLV